MAGWRRGKLRNMILIQWNPKFLNHYSKQNSFSLDFIYRYFTLDAPDFSKPGRGNSCSLRSKRFHKVCAKDFPYVRISFPLFGCAFCSRPNLRVKSPTRSIHQHQHALRLKANGNACYAGYNSGVSGTVCHATKPGLSLVTKHCYVTPGRRITRFCSLFG